MNNLPVNLWTVFRGLVAGPVGTRSIDDSMARTAEQVAIPEVFHHTCHRILRVFQCLGHQNCPPAFHVTGLVKIKKSTAIFSVNPSKVRRFYSSYTTLSNTGFLCSCLKTEFTIDATIGNQSRQLFSTCPNLFKHIRANKRENDAI